jgi:hypothetical protein
MLISRRGHAADHGPSEIRLPQPRIRWDTQKGLVLISKRGVDDFVTAARHDYTIELTLEELAGILEVVGSDPVDSCAETLSSALSPSL